MVHGAWNASIQGRMGGLRAHAWRAVRAPEATITYSREDLQRLGELGDEVKLLAFHSRREMR